MFSEKLSMGNILRIDPMHKNTSIHKLFTSTSVCVHTRIGMWICGYVRAYTFF